MIFKLFSISVEKKINVNGNFIVLICFFLLSCLTKNQFYTIVVKPLSKKTAVCLIKKCLLNSLKHTYLRKILFQHYEL